MRPIILASSAIALALAAPLPAQSPVAVQALAPGEVLLEVTAIGTARTRADRVSLTAGVVGAGETQDEAEADARRRLDRLVAAARALGLRDDEIEVRRGAALSTPMLAPAPPAPPAPLPPRSPAPPSPPPLVRVAPFPPSLPSGRRAWASVDFRLRDASRAEAVREAMERSGAGSVSGPNYSLTDDRTAIRAARADAIAQARVEAEAHARTLGMRVARMVRVSERIGFDLITMFENPGSMRRMQSTPTGNGEIETRAAMAVDFVLVPQ